MLKEAGADAEPVTLGNYAVKAKLKRETPLAADDIRVKEAIARWDQIGKHFRNIQRFEFVAPSGLPIRFDVSIVRENAGKPSRTFQEARIINQPPRYEAEVEVTAPRDSTTAEAAVRYLMRGISWLLQGRQRSFVLVTRPAEDYVRSSIADIFGSGSRSSGSNRRNAPFRYPGPQPATLERKHITAEAEPGVPNLRTMPGGYNVTDKADGLRTLLFVADDGRIFLVDGGGRVYATGKKADRSLAGTVLDGEWIRRNRKGGHVSHYYAFDILAYKGDTAVAGEPFAVAGEMLGPGGTTTRQSVMSSVVVGFLGHATQTVARVPPEENLQIGVKTFRPCGPGAEIFMKCAAATLEDAKGAPYNTDGLIFTPNAAPLPLGRGTWSEQLKWKPPHENTIDFLVIVDRAKDSVVDAIGTKYREDSGQIVRYKTLHLFVGSNRDGAFADPRTTVLSGEALPRSLEGGEWREVEFRPMEPRDPMASTCFVAIGEGGSDPAGATTASHTLDLGSDLIRSKAGEIIQSDMIVEMSYHPERAPGWRWEPMRVRHDKTERWLRQQTGQGRTGGTMNADWVANSIWTSIHNPVTEDAVRTGNVVQCAAPETLVAATTGGRRTPGRDALKIQCMANFHDYVKRHMSRRLLTTGVTVCDLAMGNGAEINRWITAPVSFAFGCDVLAPAINEPEDGAYRRLMDKMVELGGRDRIPPMSFAQADMARRLSNGEAGATAEDRTLLQNVFGQVRDGFDVVSCTFAMEYMFRDVNTLAGFLNNLADTVKVGGYFMGCGLDGDAVARLLSAESSVVMRDGRTDVWMMTKRYGSEIGSSVPPSAAGLGLAVDLDFIAMGEARTQYLMSWPYLQMRFAECGLELLAADELATLGLTTSTQMFGDALSAAPEPFAMTEAMRRYSILNRWFIFKRRTNSRPVPPNAAPAPPVGLTEMLSEPQPDATPKSKPTMSAVAEESGSSESSEEQAPKSKQEPEPYYINISDPDDPRLGADMADWPRYMSLGAQAPIKDLDNPDIVYPSIEAAIASAKYQKATDLPALGPQLFEFGGALHQSYIRKRAGLAPEALPKSIQDEMTAVRLASGSGKMKAYKATWNPDVWSTIKLDIYHAYIQQRFETDARFRDMINAIRAKNGEIFFINGADPSELGIGMRKDRSIAGGENKIGKIMQAL